MSEDRMHDAAHDAADDAAAASEELAARNRERLHFEKPPIRLTPRREFRPPWGWTLARRRDFGVWLVFYSATCIAWLWLPYFQSELHRGILIGLGLAYALLGLGQRQVVPVVMGLFWAWLISWVTWTANPFPLGVAVTAALNLMMIAVGIPGPTWKRLAKRLREGVIARQRNMPASP